MTVDINIFNAKGHFAVFVWCDFLPPIKFLKVPV